MGPKVTRGATRRSTRMVQMIILTIWFPCSSLTPYAFSISVSRVARLGPIYKS